MKPEGSVVSITYDGFQQLVEGDGLRTPTGRTYLVVAVRVQAKGKHRGRQHLRCLVGATPSSDERVFPIYWYPRGQQGPGRKRRRARGPREATTTSS